MSLITQLRQLRRLGQQLRALSAALYYVRAPGDGCGLNAATALGVAAPTPAAGASRGSLGAALAAGGAAAALALQLQPSHCEVSVRICRWAVLQWLFVFSHLMSVQAPPPPTGIGAVKAAAHALWLRLDEELHRLDASRPHGQPLPRCAQFLCRRSLANRPVEPAAFVLPAHHAPRPSTHCHCHDDHGDPHSSQAQDPGA